ncbi:hypothetical protein [Legionella sp. WA2024007413]
MFRKKFFIPPSTSPKERHKIDNWFDAVSKIALEGKETGVASTRKSGIVQSDTVSVSKEQLAVIKYLWDNVVQNINLGGVDKKQFWNLFLTSDMKEISKHEVEPTGLIPWYKGPLYLLTLLYFMNVDLSPFFKEMGIDERQYENIYKEFNVVAGKYSYCINELSKELAQTLTKMQEELRDIKVSFDGESQETLAKINQKYFELLSEIRGVYIPEEIKKEYLQKSNAENHFVPSYSVFGEHKPNPKSSFEDLMNNIRTLNSKNVEPLVSVNLSDSLFGEEEDYKDLLSSVGKILEKENGTYFIPMDLNENGKKHLALLRVNIKNSEIQLVEYIDPMSNSSLPGKFPSIPDEIKYFISRNHSLPAFTTKYGKSSSIELVAEAKFVLDHIEKGLTNSVEPPASTFGPN